MAEKPTRILMPEKNCGQLVRADRVALLINGEAYFAAFHQAVLKAQKQVLILGWDIHSKVALLRGEAALQAQSDGLPVRLGPLLDHVMRNNPDLDIRILIWDFSMLLSMERDPHLLFNLGWVPHPSICFHLDDEHPFGASHHQKIVVVDSQVAFCGGMDLSHYRWDTSVHEPDDPRRTTPAGDTYSPYHDAMMMMDGNAASALARYCALRWQQATKKTMEVRSSRGSDAWPDGVQPWFENVEVAISRTEPQYKTRPEVREVEALYLDAIQAARHFIFIENQYFTSPLLLQALEERLREKQGPEVVVILPKKTQGWLGNKIMEAKRIHVLNRLIKADLHNRLRLLSPWVGDQGVMVHAKLMVVDDQLLRVGSANLCNRSLGLDTECDLAIEAGSSRVESGIRRVRNELLAEHLGVAPAEVDALTVKYGSLLRVLDELSTPGRQKAAQRGLAPLEAQENKYPELISEAEVLDPERPLEVDQLLDFFVPDNTPSQKEGWLRGNWLWLTLGVLALILLVVAWRFTPLAELANRENLVAIIQDLAAGWTMYPLIVLAFMVGGLALFPVTVLIGATAILLEPGPALIIAFIGTQCSAAAAYGVGMKLGRRRIRSMAGDRLNRISKYLAHHGVLSMATVRLLPIAPFTIINFVAGASHIRFVDYMLGTALGMAPGILAVTIFTDQLLAFLLNPSPANILIMAGALIFLFLITRWLKRRLT
jgi:phospholipase D1/2